MKKCSLLIHKGDSKANKATKERGRKKKLRREKTSKVCFLGKLNRNNTDTSQKCERKRYCTSSNEFFKTLVWQYLKIIARKRHLWHFYWNTVNIASFFRLKGWKSSPLVQFSFLLLLCHFHSVTFFSLNAPHCLYSNKAFPFSGRMLMPEKTRLSIEASTFATPYRTVTYTILGFN